MAVSDQAFPAHPSRPVAGTGGSERAGRWKRRLDLVVAVPLLVLLLPLLAVLAAVVGVRHRRSPLFRQVRVTRGGREFTIIKLRTIRDDAGSDTRWVVPTAACDRFDRWLRVSHLDELPQLVNVLRGEMSLVGPRPERPYFSRRFALTVPHYEGRLRVPAGITGWAQVHGLHGDSSLTERVRFDNDYIDRWSPGLDVRILARTLVGLFRRQGGQR